MSVEAAATPTATQGTNPNTHVTVNAVLCYIFGGFALFGGLIAFMATMVTGAFVDQWDSSGAGAFWIQFGGVIALLVMLMIGLPAILAGIGLGKRAEWGRITALVVAAANILLGFTLVVGNVLAILNLAWGGYAFWSLLQQDVVALFQPGAQSA